MTRTGSLLSLLFAGALVACASDDSGPADAGDAATESTRTNTPVPDSATKKHPVGSPCTSAAQCEGGVCLQQFRILETVNYIMKNGYCSTACSFDGKAHNCDEGLGCQEAHPTIDKIEHYCFKECTAPTECRQSDGYTCVEGGLCFPKNPS